MSAWNFLTKIGHKSLDALKKAPGLAAKAGRFAQNISRKVGDVQHWIDAKLDEASQIPVAHDVAALIRSNPLYKGLNGSIDSVRDAVDSNVVSGIIHGAEAIDKYLNGQQHTVEEERPNFRGMSTSFNRAGAMSAPSIPSKMTQNIGGGFNPVRTIPPSSTVGSVAVM